MGISGVVSFCNTVADEWIQYGKTIQVRLPPASRNVSEATQHAQSRVCGTVGRMLEYGIKQEEMDRAIKELQFEVHL